MIKKFKIIYTLIIYMMIYIFIGTIFNLIWDIADEVNKLIALGGISLFAYFYSFKFTRNKGLKEGFKNGLMIILSLVILGFIFLKFTFTWKRFYYFIIIMACSILGSILRLKKSLKK